MMPYDFSVWTPSISCDSVTSSPFRWVTVRQYQMSQSMIKQESNAFHWSLITASLKIISSAIGPIQCLGDSLREVININFGKGSSVRYNKNSDFYYYWYMVIFVLHLCNYLCYQFNHSLKNCVPLTYSKSTSAVKLPFFYLTFFTK